MKPSWLALLAQLLFRDSFEEIVKQFSELANVLRENLWVIYKPEDELGSRRQVPCVQRDV
jgi:hypothetical protein